MSLKFKILFLVFGVSLTAFSAQDSDLVLSETSFDLGVMKEGTDTVHVFEFTNTGNDTITIDYIYTYSSEKCVDYTKTPILPKEKGQITQKNIITSKDTIKPGKQTAIEVGYVTGKNNMGKFDREIALSSNAEKIRLHIKGKVETRTEDSFGKKPDIHFFKTVHDFGVIKEEDGNVTAEFEFINTGTDDLIIENVKSSCGCLAPNWVKYPIAPGMKGVIWGTYSTESRPGSFNKSMTVNTNADKTIVLYLKGNVLPKQNKSDTEN